MVKFPIYLIAIIIGIGLIKILDVVTSNPSHYAKNKKDDFSKAVKKLKNKEKKEGEVTINPAYPKSPVSEDTTALASDQIENDLTNEDNVENTSVEKTEFAQTKSVEKYNSFAKLKNNYLYPKIAKLSPGQLRRDIIVRYYRHKQDDDKVYALKKLGYYIHEKEATETAGIDTNVLYYGEDVNIKDIQIIAHMLLEVNISLKAIKPSRFKWKSISLEIGTDTLLLKKRTLTKNDINKFKK